jgi:hypothetical protein
MKAVGGSLAHIQKLIATLSGICDRPRLDAEARYVLIGILKQEVLRRKIIESDKKVLTDLGIDPSLQLFPDWVLNSKKKKV